MEIGLHFDGFRNGVPLIGLKKNTIWVIVDRLTKFAHFAVIHDSWNVDRLARIYISEVERLHGVSQDIVSYRKCFKLDSGRL